MRRIRHVGFAVLAAMALTALLGVGTASATQFRAEEYPTTLNGKQTTTYKMKTQMGGGLACASVKTNGSLSAASSSVTLTPELKGCVWAGIAAMPIVNSCNFVFNVVHGENELMPYAGTMDIGCSKVGDAIEFKSGTGCVIRIPPQKGFALELANSPLSVRNRNRNITVSLNAANVKYEGIGGPEACYTDAGAHESGPLTGTSVIKGYNTPAAHAVGVYLSNHQVESPPLLSDEGAGVGVTSSEASMQMAFSGIGVSFICSSFQLAAPSFQGATDNLKMSVSKWQGCYWGGGFSVSPNGCILGLQATTSENEDAWGVLDIECPSGASIKFTAGGGACSVSIPTQANRAKLTFDTVGTGKERKVATGVSVSGLSYSASGVLSSCKGTHENGSLSSNFNLSSSGQGFFVLY